LDFANLRVLAVMPHPDDCEILCAGTLIRLRQCGCEIHIATMTPGDKGSATLPRPEIAAIRRDEARAGAHEIGALSYNCLEFADLEITFDNATRRRVAGLLRAVKPDVVFTTPPVDYMFDHEITSRLVRDACFNAAVPNYETDNYKTDNNETSNKEEPIPRVPTLYYTDAIGGHDLYGDPARIDCIVDITAQIAQKTAALACHDSQRAWLRKQHGIDEYIEAMRRWCALRGEQIGVAYGEGFMLHRGHPHPTADLLGSLLQAVPVGR
jgi:N-acetylglucosamine malate deacetylase 1